MSPKPRLDPYTVPRILLHKQFVHPDVYYCRVCHNIEKPTFSLHGLILKDNSTHFVYTYTENLSGL